MSVLFRELLLTVVINLATKKKGLSNLEIVTLYNLVKAYHYVLLLSRDIKYICRGPRKMLHCVLFNGAYTRDGMFLNPNSLQSQKPLQR